MRMLIARMGLSRDPTEREQLELEITVSRNIIKNRVADHRAPPSAHWNGSASERAKRRPEANGLSKPLHGNAVRSSAALAPRYLRRDIAPRRRLAPSSSPHHSRTATTRLLNGAAPWFRGIQCRYPSQSRFRKS